MRAFVVNKYLKISSIKFYIGNTAYGLLKQAKRFVKKLIEDPQYDYFDSWKVLTLFIGGNDLCSCCRWWKNYKEKYSPPNFIKGILFFDSL